MEEKRIQELQDQIRTLRRDGMLRLVEEFVRLESPSRDKPALDIWAAHLKRLLRSHTALVEIVDNALGGDHVFARFPGPTERRPALVLGHFDTVWPKGTIERMPFHIEDGRAFGPGIFDMKAGLAMFFWAMVEIIKIPTNPPVPRPIWA